MMWLAQSCNQQQRQTNQAEDSQVKKVSGRRVSRRKRAAIIRAEYNADGFVVYADDSAIYSALNAPNDCPVLGRPLPVSEVCRLALRAIRDTIAELGGGFGGVRRVQTLQVGDAIVNQG